MRVLAPGKLVLTGAYAVLDGAPALVAAVDRHATAPVSEPERVDVSALHDAEGRKLGLGSSAAAMVATAAARALGDGASLDEPSVRAALFTQVRAAHARAQGGGSGVDVAAAVHGGVLRYALQGDAAVLRPAALPPGVRLHAFWSGSSARTSDLLARVAALRAGRPGHAIFPGLRELATLAAQRLDAADDQGFVDAASAFGEALGALGAAADAPIVPPAFASLASLARSARAAFLPSGAGGGDVGVWLALDRPSDEFLARAAALSMQPLELRIDCGGVRSEPRSP